MIGINHSTGKAITGLGHLYQSTIDIITTPLGSRVMVRGYGCGLFDWIDAPTTGEFEVRGVAAIHTALLRWEPRLTVDRVTVIARPDGQVVIVLDGQITNTDTPFNQSLVLTREQLYRH